MWTYPTPGDDLPAFLALTGSYWPDLYGGANLVFDYLQSCMLVEQQIYNDLFELRDSVSRHTCPIFHTENWYRLELLQSEAIDPVTFPMPGDIREVNLAVDKLMAPSKAMTQGVDFLTDPDAGSITFVNNPFLDTILEPEPVVNGAGDVVDFKITLWLLKAGLERNFLYEQFGYVIGDPLPSGQSYRDLINAVMDAWTGATSYDCVVRLLGAVAGVPFAKETETVEVITTDATATLIITDKNVYRAALTATVVVVVGQEIHRNDPLVDTVQIFEPNQGAISGLASLEIGAGFLDPAIAGPLTFNNASTPLIVTENVLGYTKVEWVLGGNPVDVTTFFTLLHSKGVAAGSTLANYMDIRPQPQPTQPAAASLPATINPLEFLVANVLRANCLIVRLLTADFGPDALGVGSLALLRQMMPPHSTALTVVV